MVKDEKKKWIGLIIGCSLISLILGSSITYAVVYGKDKDEKELEQISKEEYLFNINETSFGNSVILDSLEDNYMNTLLKKSIKLEILKLELNIKDSELENLIKDKYNIDKELVTSDIKYNYLVEEYKNKIDIKDEELKKLYDKDKSIHMEVKLLNLKDLNESEINDIEVNGFNSKILSEVDSVLLPKNQIVSGISIQENTVHKTNEHILVSSNEKILEFDDMKEQLISSYVNNLVDSEEWFKEMEEKYKITYNK